MRRAETSSYAHRTRKPILTRGWGYCADITRVIGLRAEEEFARTLMSNALGVPVVQHDDNSEPGMYDLDVLHRDGPAGAAEVTAAADPESISFWRAIDSGERWIEPSLKGGWAVRALPSARAKELRRTLPSFLSSLEVAGIRHLGDGRRVNARLEQVASSLKIISAFQGGTDFPGSIYVIPEFPSERTGGWLADTGNALAEWLGEFLASSKCSDVRRKLADSGAPERHAFIFFPGFDSEAPFSVTDLLAIDDALLPEVDPVLPPEVTHAWAASSWSTGNCVWWSPEKGWAAIAKPALAARTSD